MKHKLLSLFALAGAMFMSTSVWALSWEAPVKPTLNEVNVEQVESGKVYYFKNVGAGQFLAGGGAWATQAVFTWNGTDDEKREALRVLVSDSTATIAHTSVTGYSLKLDGNFNTYGTSNREAYSVANTYIFRDDEQQSFIDHGSQDRGYIWIITKEENGYFRIQTAPGDPAYPNAATQYIGWLDTEGPIAVDEEGALIGTPITVVNCDLTATTEGAHIDWMLIDPTEYVAAITYYKRILPLYNSLVQAEEAGVDASIIQSAGLVYQNPDATDEEILASITSLQLAIKITGEEPPVDITSVLQNPDFSAGNISGWETNYVKGKQAQNIGYQGAQYTNGDVHIEKFIEAWLPGPSTIGDGYLQQTVYGLPAGKYRLECDAIAVQQSNSSAQTTGAYLFIQSGTLESKTSMTSGNGAPEHFSVNFSNDGGQPLSFGMKTVSTSANWIAADNFMLYYDGELTESPHYTQLKDYLTQVQEDYNTQDLGHAYCCQDSLTALDAAMLVADGITPDNSDDDCDAAYTALEKAFAGVLTSIKVYETLLIYTSLNEEGSKLAYYEEATAANKWNELSQQLHNQQETFDNAYEEGTWSDDEVKTRIDGIIPSIITWVQAHPEALTKGNDLTLLLVNADFEEGTYFAGWDAEDDEVQPEKDYGTLPGWTISSGNITQMKHVIETYHRKFDFNQTIKNMPAGVYDITVQGFVRHDGSATDQTIFYAGDLENQLMLRSDQWSLTSLYDSERDGDPCGGSGADQTIQNSKGEDVLVPNGMSGFYFWEKVENEGGAEMDYLKWKEGDFYYTNHIKATLNEPGDFTIGMKSLGNTDWIIWDNFQIIYIGDDANVYAEMAADDFNALTNAINNTDFPTLKAKTDYAEIAKEDYSAIATLEAYNAYKAKVDALIAYIQEGTKLGNTLHDLLSEYQERQPSFDASDFFNGHFAEYSTNLENGTSPDNDYLSNAPDVLAIEWTQCAVKQADTGLFNNLDGVITNPQYTTAGGDYTLNGWSMETAKEDTKAGVGNGVAEVFNATGEYKHYQTIRGLNEGYYRITVDGFFRDGQFAPGSSPRLKIEEREALTKVCRAFLFAEGGGETFVAPLKNVIIGNEVLTGVGSETTWTWLGATEGDETVEYSPDNVEAAAHYFNDVINWYAEETNLSGEADNQSVYRNALNAHVGEDGVLTIGVTNHGIAETVTNDWACFSNWTLSYMGTEAPDAIKGITTKGATAPTAIFTIDGRQASRLQRGMNIVRQADGSVRKVLVK